MRGWSSAAVRWPVRCGMALALAAAAALTAGGQAPPPDARGLSSAAELGRVYDAILDARFDEVPALRAQACPPAPPGACTVLDAVATWWRIQLNPHDTGRDAGFEAQAELAIEATTAWTTREPGRAEAWFYLGGAYATRVQWRVLRGRRLAAARDGARIKAALERALALDPDLTDAYFGLGLYHYYADVGPRALQVLRWLLLLPGGDRARGLDEMLRTRETGRLLRSEADYQLHLVYIWYEREPERALDLLGGLQARHPHNPLFRQATADIQDFYGDDTPASLRTWTALLEAAQRGDVAEAEMAEAAARLGIASQLHQLSQGTAGLEHLHAVIDARPAAPFDAVARAQLQLGQTLDALGRRADAAAAYEAAIAAASPRDPLRVRVSARSALRAHRQ